MEARFIQPQVNTAGLIGHWKFHEGTAFDYSLNGNSGTLTGTTLTYRYPGLDLEGADEHIVIDDDVIFTPTLTPFSISAWCYMHDATSFYIASKGVYNTDGEWGLYFDSSDRPVFEFFDESVVDCYIARYHNSAYTAYENQWIHIVATYDGGVSATGIKIYINGLRVDDTSDTNGIFVAVENLNHAVWIGRYSTIYANGLIDDVMIFNVEKSTAEAKSIYEVTRRRYGV